MDAPIPRINKDSQIIIWLSVTATIFAMVASYYTIKHYRLLSKEFEQHKIDTGSN